METWSPFHLGRSLQQLRSDDAGLVRRTLRALHLRWWPAQAHDMKRLIEAARVPTKTLEMIPEIVHICKACRDWARAAPNNMAVLRLAVKFIDYVQVYLLFIGELIVLHLIDEAHRSSAGGLLASQDTNDVLRGIALY